MKGDTNKHEHSWLPIYTGRHSSDFIGDYFIIEFSCETCEAELFEFCEAKPTGEDE